MIKYVSYSKNKQSFLQFYVLILVAILAVNAILFMSQAFSEKPQYPSFENTFSEGTVISKNELNSNYHTTSTLSNRSYADDVMFIQNRFAPSISHISYATQNQTKQVFLVFDYNKEQYIIPTP